MIYKTAVKMFEKRKAGAPYKVLDPYLCLRVYEELGEARFYLRHYEWLHTGAKYVKRELDPIELAVVDSDDVFRMALSEENKGRLKDLSTRSRLEKVIGRGRVSSDTGSTIVNPYTYRNGNVVAPLDDKLRVNTRSHTILERSPMIKAVTNRSRSRPVYTYVDSVVKVLTVMMRMGEFDPLQRDYRHPKVRDILAAHDPNSDIGPGVLTDELVPLLATAAYQRARIRATLPCKNYHWWEGGQMQVKPNPDYETEFESAILNYARRYLIEDIKAHIGTYDFVET